MVRPMILHAKCKEKFRQISVIIPAAGSGKRFSSTNLKILSPFVGNLTVLERTLSIFAPPGNLFFAKILVAAPSGGFTPDFEARLRQKFLGLEITSGGSERVYSVEKALRAVQTDWVLVHDAARPLLQWSDLLNLIDARGPIEGDGAVLGTPVRDSLKRVEDPPGELQAGGATMSGRVAREHLWNTLTPQIFPTKRLKLAFERSSGAKKFFQDEAEAVFFDGGKPKVIQGAWSNLKLTYPEDLLIMRHLDGQQTLLQEDMRRDLSSSASESN